MAEYLAAGSRLVWVIDTDRRLVEVHRLTSAASVIEERDALDGEAVVPGFRVPLADLFEELD